MGSTRPVAVSTTRNSPTIARGTDRHHDKLTVRRRFEPVHVGGRRVLRLDELRHLDDGSAGVVQLGARPDREGDTLTRGRPEPAAATQSRRRSRECRGAGARGRNRGLEPLEAGPRAHRAFRCGVLLPLPGESLRRVGMQPCVRILERDTADRLGDRLTPRVRRFLGNRHFHFSLSSPGAQPPLPDAQIPVHLDATSACPLNLKRTGFSNGTSRL